MHSIDLTFALDQESWSEVEEDDLTPLPSEEAPAAYRRVGSYKLRKRPAASATNPILGYESASQFAQAVRFHYAEALLRTREMFDDLSSIASPRSSPGGASVMSSTTSPAVSSIASPAASAPCTPRQSRNNPLVNRTNTFEEDDEISFSRKPLASKRVSDDSENVMTPPVSAFPYATRSSGRRRLAATKASASNKKPMTPTRARYSLRRASMAMSHDN